MGPDWVELNGVKWIIWFLAACHNKSGFFLTFKHFHQLFTLVNLNKSPFYEIRFRGDECGLVKGDAKPVMQQSSLKGWSREVIFLKGLDIEYMPLFAARSDIVEREVFQFEGEALDRIHSFCECLGFQMFELGCLPQH